MNDLAPVLTRHELDVDAFCRMAEAGIAGLQLGEIDTFSGGASLALSAVPEIVLDLDRILG